MQALWMLLGAFFFASMAVCVKFASATFTSSEMVFWRGLIGMAMLWPMARRSGISLVTHHPRMHATRSVVGVVSLTAWYYAIGQLPLATALTLNYMSSVWIAAFVVGGSLLAWSPRQGAAPLRSQAPLALAVLAGFAGVIMVLRPTLEQQQIFAGLLGLASGLTAAIALMQVRAMGRVGEPELRIVFYLSLSCLVLGLAGMAVTGLSPWSWPALRWLIPMAVLATLGQLCITRAYGHGATLVVASLQYSGILFGALYGLALFGDRIALTGWLGMALILASGLGATALRARAARNVSAKEH